MKGPGLRIDLDVRRIWRCAKCGKTLRTPGQVTAQRCGCSDETPWMRLELAPKREPFQPPHREPLPEFGDEPEAAAEPVSEQPPADPIAGQPPIATSTAEPPQSMDVQTPDTPQPAVEVPIVVSAETPPPADDFGAGLAAPPVI